MTDESFRRVFDHLPDEKVEKIDLFLYSDGGDSVVPWRLMTLLREYADKVDVLVPYRAFSAATMACLGADEIVMHPMGMLGPIDPTVHDPFGPTDPNTGQVYGVNVEDVSSFIALVKDDVGIRHEDELIQAFQTLAAHVHPLTLGHVKRGTAQARMLGEKLLRLRDGTMEPHAIDQILEHLTSKLYYHGHPINRREAKEELDLHVTNPERDVEEAIWELYLAYEEEMSLASEFDFLGEALAQQPQLIAGQWESIELPENTLVIIESPNRADVLRETLQVSLTVQPDGTFPANVARIKYGWKSE